MTTITHAHLITPSLVEFWAGFYLTQNDRTTPETEDIAANFVRLHGPEHALVLTRYAHDHPEEALGGVILPAAERIAWQNILIQFGYSLWYAGHPYKRGTFTNVSRIPFRTFFQEWPIVKWQTRGLERAEAEAAAALETRYF